MPSKPGHTGITMTSRYAHYGPEHAKKAAQVVSFDVPETASVLRFDPKREKKWSESGQNHHSA